MIQYNLEGKNPLKPAINSADALDRKFVTRYQTILKFKHDCEKIQGKWLGLNYAQTTHVIGQCFIDNVERVNEEFNITYVEDAEKEAYDASKELQSSVTSTSLEVKLQKLKEIKNPTKEQRENLEFFEEILPVMKENERINTAKTRLFYNIKPLYGKDYFGYTNIVTKIKDKKGYDINKGMIIFGARMAWSSWGNFNILDKDNNIIETSFAEDRTLGIHQHSLDDEDTVIPGLSTKDKTYHFNDHVGGRYPVSAGNVQRRFPADAKCLVTVSSFDNSNRFQHDPIPNPFLNVIDEIRIDCKRKY